MECVKWCGFSLDIQSPFFVYSTHNFYQWNHVVTFLEAALLDRRDAYKAIDLYVNILLENRRCPNLPPIHKSLEFGCSKS